MRTALLCSAVLTAAVPATAQEQVVYTNARVVTAPGKVLERANIVVSGGRIIAVAPNADSTGAAKVDLTGMTVYPGLIDAFCLAGASAPPTSPARPTPSAPPSSAAGAQGRRNPSQSAAAPAPAAPLVWRKATDGWDAKDSAVVAMRNYGYTSINLGVRGTLTPGENAVVSTADGDVKDRIVKERTGVNLNLLSRGMNTYPGTLMGALAFVRQALYDGIADPEGSPQNQAMAMAATGRIPAFFTGSTENEILRALNVKREFGMNLAVLGARESVPIARLIAERGGLLALDDWTIAPDLWKAGVRTLLVSNKILMGTSEADGLREKMVELVRKGVSPDKLLEMLTIVPAAYLGIADRVGTLEPGKQADFIVTRGDLFTDAGKPLFTVVAGKRFDIKQMAASPKRIQTASDGVPYRNIAEDDADGHGDGGVR